MRSIGRITLFSVIGKNFVRLYDYGGHRANRNTAAHRLLAQVTIGFRLTDLAPFHEDRLGLLNLAVGAEGFFKLGNLGRLSPVVPGHVSRECNVRLDRRRLDRLYDDGVRCYFTQEPHSTRVLWINDANDRRAGLGGSGIEQRMRRGIDEAQEKIGARIEAVVRRPFAGGTASQPLEITYKEFAVIVARMRNHDLQAVEINARSRQRSLPSCRNLPSLAS